MIKRIIDNLGSPTRKEQTVEIKQGTLVAVIDLKVSTGHYTAPTEEIGLVLGVHHLRGPFVRTQSYRGYYDQQKLVPLFQTDLGGGLESERLICDQVKLSEYLLAHFSQLVAAAFSQINQLFGRTDWLAEHKTQR